MNKKILSLLLVLVMALSFVSCADNGADTAAQTTEAAGNAETPDTGGITDDAETEKVPAEGLWADAVYRSDKSFGNGAKTIEVEVKAEDKSVTFTIKTDAVTGYEQVPANIAQKIIKENAAE